MRSLSPHRLWVVGSRQKATALILKSCSHSSGLQGKNSVVVLRATEEEGLVLCLDRCPLRVHMCRLLRLQNPHGCADAS